MISGLPPPVRIPILPTPFPCARPARSPRHGSCLRGTARYPAHPKKCSLSSIFERQKQVSFPNLDIHIRVLQNSEVIKKTISCKAIKIRIS